MSPTERFKFEFLAGLVHQGTLMPLPNWLLSGPEWTHEFVAQLLDDGLVYLFTAHPDDDVSARVDDAETWLSPPEARALMITPFAAHQAWNVWLAPTRSGSSRFAEANVSELFEYVSDTNGR